MVKHDLCGWLRPSMLAISDVGHGHSKKNQKTYVNFGWWS